MRALIEMSKREIREAICDYIKGVSGISLSPDDVTVQVKSKHNYRSEWEEAHFRAIFTANQRGK